MNLQYQTELEAAFKAFNEMSGALRDSYCALEARVAQLTAELAEVSDARLKELAEKEKLANRLTALLSALPGGVVVLDRQSNVVEINPEAQELLGEACGESSLVGMNWDDVIVRASRPGTFGNPHLELDTGQKLSVCDRALDSDGNRVILLTDVTEPYARQESVNREKRLTALGEMSARLAHQVRTPLAAALLYMSQLGQNRVSREDRLRLVPKVVDRLHHMESLTTGMLEFVRGEASISGWSSIPDLISDFRTSIEPQITEQGGILRIFYASELDEIWVNRDALTSALINIAENAVQLIETPRIEVTVTGYSDKVEFCVKDNGPGIEDSIIDKIFDPFFTTRAKGTGLGLAIAAMVAREHGGEINVANNASGGACVTLSIARKSPLAAWGAGSPPAGCGVVKLKQRGFSK